MSRPTSRNTDRQSSQSQSQSHSRSTSRRSSTHQSNSSSNQPQPDPLAFCNSFWGDLGYDALQTKTRQSSKMLEDLRTWYKERASIEDDYAKRLAKLTKSPLLDSDCETEVGGIKKALEIVRETTRQSAHSHAELAGTVRTALERKVADFVVRRDGLRKNPQGLIDRLHKKKIELMEVTEKSRRKYEADAIAVNGLSAQTHLVQGRDYDKVSAKLDKAQQNVQVNERDYKAHVKNLKETTAEWNLQWKAYCDLSQDLEEDRIDFVRTSFWDYANGVSTICVVDDEQCENIRKALERCETAHDVAEFARQTRTGSDIYIAPDYVNYARGEQTPYGRPPSSTANFIRSSTRNPRLVPSTTSIQDLAHAIRSGPASPTDTISPSSARASSKAAAKRGGAIADAVAANAFTGDSAAGLTPKPSMTRSTMGASISRAASPAEAMAQVLGGGNNAPNGNHRHTASAPTNRPPSASGSYQSQQYNQESGSAYGDQPPPPPPASAKPANRYAPPEPRSNSRPAPGSNSAVPNNLPPPSHRPPSRSATPGSIHPPSVPAENGSVDPLVAALEKLRTTPSIGSIRRGATSPAPPKATRRSSTMDVPNSNAQQYKRASSPAPSAAMMKPPYDPRTHNARSTSPGPHNPYDPRAPSPAPSARPSSRMSYQQSSHPQSQPPPHQQQQHPHMTGQQTMPLSYAGSSRNPPLGISLDARGGIMDRNASPGPPSSRGAKLGQQINHRPSQSQPNNTMMSNSPTSYVGSNQGPFRQPQPQQQPPPSNQPPPPSPQRQQSMAPQQHQISQHQQGPPSSYSSRPTTHHYGYAPPPASQPPPTQTYQAPPPPSVAPPTHYALPPSQSFPPQHQYYQPPGQPQQQQQQQQQQHPPPNSTNGVQRTSSMYGGGVQQQQQPQQLPPSQYYHPPPSNPAPVSHHPAPPTPSPAAPNQNPSPTGNYTETGQPILFYVRALYDYNATMPEEFSFQSNDIIAITQTDPDGWWQGELLDESRRRKNGGGNVLPSNFVDLLN